MQQHNVLNITINGIDYIAKPKGSNIMFAGLRKLMKEYERCPEFFDKIIRSGFDYFLQEEFAYFFASNNGIVYCIYEKDIDPDTDAIIYEMPDISGWNIADFEENMALNKSIYRYDSIRAASDNLTKCKAYVYCNIAAMGNELRGQKEIECVSIHNYDPN